MVEGLVHASEVSHLRLLDQFTATEGGDHVLDVQQRIKGWFTFRTIFQLHFDVIFNKIQLKIHDNVTKLGNCFRYPVVPDSTCINVLIFNGFFIC